MHWGVSIMNITLILCDTGIIALYIELLTAIVLIQSVTDSERGWLQMVTCANVTVLFTALHFCLNRF